MAACFVLLAASPAVAQSMFSRETLIRALEDYYCTFPGQPAGSCPDGTVGATEPLYEDESALEFDAGAKPPKDMPEEAKKAWKYTTADQKIWALEIFDQIVLQNVEDFNVLLVDLASDYLRHPSRRKGIELLLSMIDVQSSAGVKGIKDKSADAARDRLRSHFIERRRESKTLKALNGALKFAFAAWCLRRAKGTIQGGYLYWISRGRGLTRMERFREGLMLALSDAHRGRKSVWIVRGAAVGYGIIDVAIDSFREARMDPREALFPAREQIIEDAGELAASQRDELRTTDKLEQEDLKAKTQDVKKRLEEIDADATRIKNELGHLYEVAAELRPRMSPVAEDLVEIRKRIDSIQGKLDLIELMDGEGDFETLGERKLP